MNLFYFSPIKFKLLTGSSIKVVEIRLEKTLCEMIIYDKLKGFRNRDELFKQ